MSKQTLQDGVAELRAVVALHYARKSKVHEYLVQLAGYCLAALVLHCAQPDESCEDVDDHEDVVEAQRGHRHGGEVDLHMVHRVERVDRARWMPPLLHYDVFVARGTQGDDVHYVAIHARPPQFLMIECPGYRCLPKVAELMDGPNDALAFCLWRG